MFVCSVPPQIKVPGSSFEFLYPHRLGCKGLPGISWDIVHRKKYNVYHSWVWHTWLEKHFGCSIDSFLEGQVIRRDWFYLIWQQTVIGIGVIIIKHVRENFAAHCFSDGFFPVHAMKRTNRKRIMPGAPPTQPLLGPDQVKNKDTYRVRFVRTVKFGGNFLDQLRRRNNMDETLVCGGGLLVDYLRTGWPIDQLP